MRSCPVIVVLTVLSLLAAAASAETIYGTDRDKVWSIDTTTLVGTQVAATPGGQYMYEALAIKPGTSAGLLGAYAKALYPVDVTAGTIGSDIGCSGYEIQALAYDSSGQLWGYDDWSGPDLLVSINDTTGVCTGVGSRTQRVNAMTFIGGTAYIWTEGLGLATVDVTTGVITDVNPLIGSAPTHMSGLVQGSSGVVYGSNWGNNLYTINLATGEATLLGSVAGVGTFEGLSAIVTIPEPATMTLLALGGLALIRRKRA